MDPVEHAATRFRRAFETIDTGYAVFADFPRGSCGDVSELLGAYLRHCGFGEWKYWFGSHDKLWQSHAWVEQDGLIVDITADQFPQFEAPPAVIVTTDDTWHNRYFPGSGPRHTAGLNYWSGASRAQVERAYELIRDAADALH